MSLLALQHVAEEDAAQIGRVFAAYGHRLRTVGFWRGDALPPDLDDIDGLIVMGGPMNVDEQLQHPWMAGELAFIKRAHDAKLPVVGVCLGAQLIAAALGGQVEAMAGPEVGWHNVRLAFPGTIDTILAGIPWNTAQFHLHGQHVTQLPPGATPLAGSQACKHQAFRVGMTTYAFQYHFEWNRDEINRFSNDALVEKAGALPHDIRQQADDHYDGYRRLGDRLCHNLATFLFPIDKRRGRYFEQPLTAAPEAARP